MNPQEQLSTEECWTLLRTHSLGRVAFTEKAMPTIVPVDYSLQDGHLHLHCGSERLADVLDRQVVAFEVDDTLARRSDFSSVVVTGTAERATGATVVLRCGRVRGRRAAHAA